MKRVTKKFFFQLTEVIEPHVKHLASSSPYVPPLPELPVIGLKVQTVQRKSFHTRDNPKKLFNVIQTPYVAGIHWT